ncbi:MAG TPA: hypothetical protein VN696_05175 [Pyrinomonadaceae bacterium]|nr:hypothetical protein [Pyrinomonadaceae bacterium]
MIDTDDHAAYREEVKQNFGFSEWAGQTKEADREVRSLDLQTMTVPIAEHEDLPTSSRQRRIVRYIFGSAGKGGQLVSMIYECNSTMDAHETLIDVVMTYMAPKLPRCGEKGLEIGDICFAGASETNVSVIFARFNILAEVRSVGQEPVSVDALARGLDELILSQAGRSGPGDVTA